MSKNKKQSELIEDIEKKTGRKYNEAAIKKLTEPFHKDFHKAYVHLQEAQVYAATLYKDQMSDEVYYALSNIHVCFKRMASDITRIHESMIGKGAES